MKVYCAKSGIPYSTGELFNYDGIHAIHEHPIFSFSNAQLLGFFEHVYSGEGMESNSSESSSTEQYLLCLALLNKLPNQWKCQVNKELALPYALKYLEPLARLVEKVNANRQYLNSIPSIVIDKTTNDLRCLSDWINAYNEAYAEATNISAAFRRGKQVSRLESVIDRLIAKGFDKNRSRISKVVADWAVVAGDFPVSVKELWYDMVQVSFSDDFLSVLGATATLADYDELIEHCEDYIPHGSTLAAVLMRKLRDARAMIQEFTAPTKAQKAAKLAEIDLSDISDEEDSREIPVPVKIEATGKVIIGISKEPIKSEYPDSISYLRDLIRWRKAHGIA